MGLTAREALRTIQVEPIPCNAMRLFSLIVVLSIFGVTTASAQTLADVARKETERRQGVRDGGKTYTNQDLKSVPQPATDSPAASPDPKADTPAAAANDSSGGDEKSTDTKSAAKSDRDDDDSAKVKDQEYWSSRMAQLREQLERDQTFMDALQSRIDALTADFVNRDDPAQRGQISADRQKALAELDRLRKALEQDKRAIPELEEEARRSGVPAGWLR
jgi:hypothetical protein